MLKRIVLHPFLMASYPILVLLAYNIDQLVPWNALRSLLISLAVAFFLYYAIKSLVKDSYKAAALVTLFLLLFYTYGHVYGFIEDFQLFGTNVGRHRLLFPIWVGLCALGGWLILKGKRSLESLNHGLNVVLLVALLMPVAQVASYYLFESRASVASAAEVTDLQGTELLDKIGAADATSGKTQPDIYYIVLDAYTRDDTLRKVFKYDNTEFINSLEKMGFYVARCSQSNYSSTQLSLASSLNMNYMEEFAQDLESANSTTFLNQLLAHNLSRRALEKLGYRIVAVDSGYSPTEWVDADTFLSPRRDIAKSISLMGGMNAFEALVARTSGMLLLYDIKSLLPPQMRSFLDAAYSQHRENILFAFDELENIPELPGPKFVFVHILAPHEPFVFGPQGELVGRNTPFSLNNDWDTKNLESYRHGYRDQVNYVNTRILKAVQEIIARSAAPPIIILQGDHGTLARVSSQNARMTILNAYYLPGGGKEFLYGTITPVNTFRLILDHYFGADLGLLDDSSYYYDEDSQSFPQVLNKRKLCEGPVE